MAGSPDILDTTKSYVTAQNLLVYDCADNTFRNGSSQLMFTCDCSTNVTQLYEYIEAMKEICEFGIHYLCSISNNIYTFILFIETCFIEDLQDLYEFAIF